ncbi:hypothetical protein OIO90_005847 [Microbotryomycetes sp. JL221]|nr:hypothetical protein OIO90_005847 [Microbotryomycetes sp. JL221]
MSNRHQQVTGYVHDALATSDAVQATESLNKSIEALREDHQLALALWPLAVGTIVDNRPDAVVEWAANVVQLTMASKTLSKDTRTQLATQSIRTFAKLLEHTNTSVQKLALQAFASAYPLLFKHASDKEDQQTWSAVLNAKTVAVQLWRQGALGCKLSAIKVVQRIIQTHTRGTADPRLQRNAEPNLGMVRPDHPFLNINALEDEASKLMEQVITLLFTSTVPDIISAVVTSVTSLTKLRPTFANLVVTALTNWSPTTLTNAGHGNSPVRSVEKVVRVSLTHLLKHGNASAFSGQINEFLGKQLQRMEQAANEARLAREQESNRKRQRLADDIANSVKRRKTDDSITIVQDQQKQEQVDIDIFNLIGDENNALARFDVSNLPMQLVVDLVVSNLQLVTDSVLQRVIERVRNRLPEDQRQVLHAPSPSYPALTEVDGPSAETFIKAEPIDPLAMDLGSEELDMKPEVLIEPQDEQESDQEENQDITIDFNFGSTTDELRHAHEIDAVGSNDLSKLSKKTKTLLVKNALKRICEAGTEGSAPAIWVPLVVRLATRGLESQKLQVDDDIESHQDDEELSNRREELRKVIFDFVTADVRNRLDFAILWLNEEWYSSRRTKFKDQAYDRWLKAIMDHLTLHTTNKDKALTQFVVDLPELSLAEVERIKDMCLKPNQVQLGFMTLHELATLRPRVRRTALDQLLSLCTHTERMTRNAAINTVKRWVPETEPLGSDVVTFALSLFARMEQAPVVKEEQSTADGEEAKTKTNDDDDMAMEATPSPPPPQLPYALVEDGQVVARLEAPTTMNEVQRHAELLLALCSRNPDLLMHVFEGYVRLQPFAQESLRTLIIPLIRSLGLQHPKVLDAISAFPNGSDQLVLKILIELGDKPRQAKNIIDILQQVADRRDDDLPAQMYSWIIADCDKPSVLRYLPKIVATLNNTPEKRTAMRSTFLAVTAPPSMLMGKTVRNKTKDDSVTPVELMTLLHKRDKEIGVKQTIEAIGICFSMTDAFRPETLMNFMTSTVEQRDEPIPVLFMRTVIQALSTYKTLTPFVAGTLLPKLIMRQVWELPPLWEGFVRCVKATSPVSFAACLQLPRVWLKDVVERQPTLRAPLRDFVLQKSATGKAPDQELLQVLGGLPEDVQQQDENAMVHQQQTQQTLLS